MNEVPQGAEYLVPTPSEVLVGLFLLAAVVLLVVFVGRRIARAVRSTRDGRRS